MKQRIIIIFFLLVSLFPANVFARHHSGEGPVTTLNFAVHVRSDQPLHDSLVVQYWRDLTFSPSVYDGGYFAVPVSGNHDFYFSIPPIEHPGRMTLFDRDLGGFFITEEIIEPGDHIDISVVVTNRHILSLHFSGTGSGKYPVYPFFQKWKTKFDQLGEKTITTPKEYEALISKSERYRDSCLRVLPGFKKQISNTSYSLLYADMTAYIRNSQLLLSVRAYTHRDSRYGDFFEKELIHSFSAPTEHFSDTVFLYSTSWTRYIYQRSKLKLVYEHNSHFREEEFSYYNKSISFDQLYCLIKESYTGLTREYLLAYSLLNPREINLFFGGCDPASLTYCLTDAAYLIQTPFLQQLILQKKNAIGSGSAVYPFALADRSGRIVRSTDFAGKVVLIDFWSEGCTGCLMFIQQYDSTILPIVKNDTNFVVVSININAEKNRWLSSLPLFSRPGFIDLTTGEPGIDHPLLKYYDISAIPFTLLTDNNGKIISGTLRDCNELLSLIRPALEKLKR